MDGYIRNGSPWEIPFRTLLMPAIIKHDISLIIEGVIADHRAIGTVRGKLRMLVEHQAIQIVTNSN